HRVRLGDHPNRVNPGHTTSPIPSAGSVAARHRAGNPRRDYEQPAPNQGWPRPILDSGSPRRTMVLRSQPAYISLTARRAQPAGPPPTQPTAPPPPSAHARNQYAPLDNRLSISVARAHEAAGLPPWRSSERLRA